MTPSSGQEARPLPPPLCGLLDLLREALGTQAPATASLPDLTPEQWQALLVRHRVGSFLHHRLPEASKKRLPAALRDLLQRQARQNAQRSMVQMAELVRVSALLAQNGIPTVSIKGPLLARELYGEIGQRHAGDVDLLVAQENVVAADAVLLKSGYTRTKPCEVTTPKRMQHSLRMFPEFEYIRTDKPVQRLELRWRWDDLPMAAEAFWTGPVVNVSGQSLHQPPERAHWLYLFQHGARHGWFRLFWLVDIALLLQRRPESAWAEDVVWAKRWQLERALWQGTALAERWLGMPCPPVLKPERARDRHKVDQLVKDAAWFVVGPPSQERKLTGRIYHLGYSFRIGRFWRHRWHVMKGFLFSYRNWQQLSLPDRWFFLYFILVPFLWAGWRWKLWRQKRGRA